MKTLARFGTLLGAVVIVLGVWLALPPIPTEWIVPGSLMILLAPWSIGFAVLVFRMPPGVDQPTEFVSITDEMPGPSSDHPVTGSSRRVTLRL